eukprot:CAMPEP_0197243728 /NCGR_PEP_ID=MMETSP1429-20130617/9082_1 /TAXON_ID=49237 /ORGANISM="Chaetoceros  sp., Strain UNC1202" /LENGTH=392 /DNA_ID=CAMNT_0042703993 /DNA_START=183 /DNA_END=1358 /DNA_ORIENTATION=-
MAYTRHLLRYSAAPAAAIIVSNFFNYKDGSERDKFPNIQILNGKRMVSCEAKISTNGHATGTRTDDKPSIMKEEKIQINSKIPVDPTSTTTIPSTSTPVPDESKDKKDQEEDAKSKLFHGLFPLRQLWKPQVEYPLWDNNWDDRKPPSAGDRQKDHEHNRHVRKNGVTRHIILIRHGQYDETHREDEKRILTPLGREQAELTGQRLAEIIRGIQIDERFGPCHVSAIRVSNMTRAKETANIIASFLPDSVERAEPDADLNEGRPCHHIPGGRASETKVRQIDDGHARIEQAFKKYIHRADPPPPMEIESEKEKTMDSPAGEENTKDPQNGDIAAKPKEEQPKMLAAAPVSSTEQQQQQSNPNPHHEFEIIVCHANVIRYFLCRALQIPPEAW